MEQDSWSNRSVAILFATPFDCLRENGESSGESVVSVSFFPFPCPIPGRTNALACYRYGLWIVNIIIKHLFILLVFINYAECVASCKGTVADIKCTTTTGTGFLLWQNSSGKSFGFDDTATVGADGTLGSTTMTLNSIEPVSNAVVYTSTASENMMENTTKQCSDGDVLESINVTVKSMETAYMCTFIVHVLLVTIILTVVIVHRSIKPLMGLLSM